MRTIKIDLDVHKAIEGARVTFDESENSILRRMLGLRDDLSIPQPMQTGSLQSPREIGVGGSRTDVPNDRVQGREWRSGSVALPHGTKLKANYNKIDVFGEVQDGYIVVNGKKYVDLSPAIIENVRTKSGTMPSLNGWIYWKALRPGSNDWKRLDEIKRENIRLEDLL